MDAADIIAALYVYLGGDAASRGIDPVGGEARVRATYGSQASAVLCACKRAIAELSADDESYKLGSLAEIGAAATEAVAARHPNWPRSLAEKLGNLYAYQSR